ncbi:MAG: allantoicase [Myxococcaceae bacterium]|nr:allantoicase [Myxococcaceae bacterium]
MANAPVAPEFAHLVDLSADALGTFVLFATDDYFAEKENLLKPGAPEWREGAYTDKGKWMDGWESQRRRTEGHDWAVLRLGASGRVHGALVDTTHFKGNAPQEVALEGLEAPLTATAEALEAATGWFEVLPRQPVKPDFPNVLRAKAVSARVTHVRLRIFPDGGVARLRVYGEVVAEPRTFWRRGSVDLAAVENGGTIAAVSDMFFGPPSNLLLPGRGVNMGDGWETKRRRTPGSDWCVIKLARRGVVERLELDTHYFKGNAPQATLVEALDEETLGAEAVAALLRAPKGWQTLLARTPLVQHRRHQLEPDRPLPVTHLRVHIFPHGGVNRLRVLGTALDTPAERQALEQLHALSVDEASALFLSCCGARAWAETMAALRPFGSVRELFAAAESVWWKLGTTAWLDAFAAHPRIGSSKKGKAQTAKSAAWSKGEQRGVAASEKAVLAKLKALNEAYIEKFGFIFIVFATGKSAPEMLALLEERVGRPKKAELETAAVEQMKITRLRLEKWLTERGGER